MSIWGKICKESKRIGKQAEVIVQDVRDDLKETVKENFCDDEQTTWDKICKETKRIGKQGEALVRNVRDDLNESIKDNFGDDEKEAMRNQITEQEKNISKLRKSLDDISDILNRRIDIGSKSRITGRCRDRDPLYSIFVDAEVDGWKSCLVSHDHEMRPQNELSTFDEIRALVPDGRLWRDVDQPIIILKNYAIVEWLDPSTLYKKEASYEYYGEFDHQDIAQGIFGDCWFVAALYSVGMYSNLIVFDGILNKKHQDHIKGVYEFHFWDEHLLKRTVCVDRFIPCVDKEPICMTRKRDKEDCFIWWPSLVEKAFAKLFKSYNDIDGGFPSYAFTHLTGYRGWHYNRFENNALMCNPDCLWNRMVALWKNGHIFCIDWNKADFNLISGHAYSVLDLFVVENRRVLKVRNPWGTAPWNGNEIEACYVKEVIFLIFFQF
jgi:hypothetical protein